MKRILSLIFVAVIALTLSSCSDNNPEAVSTTAEEAQPTGFITEAEAETQAETEPVPVGKDLTALDVISYFTKAGLFVNGDGYKLFVQDHENYWSNTPVKECVCWWDNTETKVSVNILIFDSSLEDTDKETYNKWLREIEITKSLPAENFSFGFIDHLAGNVAFSYSQGTTDPEILKKTEAAYEQFIKDTGLKPVY
ncbi:MAG: hypothetical protein K6C14_01680 [Eubacterium sp.]|nr:hypothetical protein [Eubacterium sp.]